MTSDPDRDLGPRLHRRQFVIGPRPRPMVGWSTTSIGDGLVLSHCQQLRMVRRRDRDGVEWVLLGLATQTRADGLDPPEDLAASTTAEVPRAYESWAGRWALIGDGELHLDATAQLACHWLIDDDGHTWASSSPALAAELVPERTVTERDLHYERGLSWVVPPVGTVDGVHRLLPSQILDLATGTTSWRRLIVAQDELGLDADRSDAALSGFIEALGQAMRRLPAEQPRHLGLTAGADSRLMLAAAVAADVEVGLHTRLAARMSVADRLLPPRLAAAVGLDHDLLRPGPTDPARLALARAHSAGHVSDGDALPFAQGVRDDLRGIEMGGQGLGIGKVKHRTLPVRIDDPDRLAAVIADEAGEPSVSPNRAALAIWLAAVVEHEASQRPADRLDWRDRIYLEQRTAGWQAAKEQVYDLNRHERFFPINGARTIGLLLAIDPERRVTGEHRRDLIERAEPRLLAEPFNPPGSSFPRRTQLGHVLAVDRGGLAARVRRRRTTR